VSNPDRLLSRNGWREETERTVSLDKLASLTTLAVSRFSLISRCTHRAHAALQLFEKIELSFQSIKGATEKRLSGVEQAIRKQIKVRSRVALGFAGA
jgi:hypothetical protein